MLLAVIRESNPIDLEIINRLVRSSLAIDDHSIPVRPSQFSYQKNICLARTAEIGSLKAKISERGSHNPLELDRFIG